MIQQSISLIWGNDRCVSTSQSPRATHFHLFCHFYRPAQLRKIREAREAVDARFAENTALLMERQAEKQTSATRRRGIEMFTSIIETHLLLDKRVRGSLKGNRESRARGGSVKTTIDSAT